MNKLLNNTNVAEYGSLIIHTSLSTSLIILWADIIFGKEKGAFTDRKGREATLEGLRMETNLYEYISCVGVKSA